MIKRILKEIVFIITCLFGLTLSYVLLYFLVHGTWPS